MALKYLTQNVGSTKEEVIIPQIPPSRTQTTSIKTRRRNLLCLLPLLNIIVWNAAYGLFTAEKDTPILKTITSDNLIYKLWTRSPFISSSSRKGMVIGILFNEANPAALIDNELVHEGATLGRVKVVKISSKKIQFEKNGKMWTQGVREKPNAVW